MLASAEVADGLTQLLLRSLRAKGIPVVTIERDERWAMMQEPVAVRMVPKPIGTGAGVMPQHFYRSLFRWKMDDGQRFSVALDPIIRKRGRYYEVDGIGLLGKLAGHIRTSATAAA